MRNIILVTVDSLRIDHCGFFDPEFDLTPALDALAKDGMTFENAIAPGPRTPSSMPVVWTGEHIDARNFGVYCNYDEKRSRATERRRRIRNHLTRYPTLPERLAERGYTTAGITANPWTNTDTAFDRGFDTFSAVGEASGVERTDFTAKLGELVTDTKTDEWMLRWTDFYEVITQARTELSEPYFLWIFLLDPHQPYFAPGRYRDENTSLEMYLSNIELNRYFYTDTPPSFVAARIKRAYRDTIRSVDAFVARLLEDLNRDDPLMILHSDHGEAFGRHGFYGHRPQLYEESVHVPLLISGIENTQTITEPVSLRQVPHIVEACSTESFTADEITSPAVITKTEETERIAVRSMNWKYIRGGESWDYVQGSEGEELYNLSADQLEETNQIHARPNVTELMEQLLGIHQQNQNERYQIADAVNSINHE